MINNRLIISSLLMMTMGIASAQEFTVSPYSVFGIGDIQLGESGLTSGMAGTGISLSGGHFLNTLNPASLAALDTNTFIFDMSGSARGSRFTSGNITQKAFSANFTKITAGLHITRRWSAAVSVQPYSTVSYKIETEDYIEGSEVKTTTAFQGSGGVTRYSFLNSYKLTPHFSLGADMMLLAGTIDRSAAQSGITVKENSTASKLMFNLGLQYTEKLAPGLVFAAGIIYGHGGVLDFDNTLRVVDGSENELFNDIISSTRTTIPDVYGTGISFIGNHLVVSADYRHQRWSQTRDQSAMISFTDTHKFNAGAAFTPRTVAATSYFEQIQYQAGFTISNSWLTFKNINPINLELTAGALLPLRGGTQMNVAFSWGKNGTTREGLIREDYFRMTLSFSLAERMFLKRMYD